MAHSKQALKRVRQNERDRVANKAKASRMRTEVKKLMSAVTAGDKKAAEAMLPVVFQVIDKAAKDSIIHANTAARKKSQISRAIAAI